MKYCIFKYIKRETIYSVCQNKKLWPIHLHFHYGMPGVWFYPYSILFQHEEDCWCINPSTICVYTRWEKVICAGKHCSLDLRSELGSIRSRVLPLWWDSVWRVNTSNLLLPFVYYGGQKSREANAIQEPRQESGCPVAYPQHKRCAMFSPNYFHGLNILKKEKEKEKKKHALSRQNQAILVALCKITHNFF